MTKQHVRHVAPTSSNVVEIEESLRKKSADAMLHDIGTEQGARKRLIEAACGVKSPSAADVSHQEVRRIFEIFGSSPIGVRFVELGKAHRSLSAHWGKRVGLRRASSNHFPSP